MSHNPFLPIVRPNPETERLTGLAQKYHCHLRSDYTPVVPVPPMPQPDFHHTAEQLNHRETWALASLRRKNVTPATKVALKDYLEHIKRTRRTGSHVSHAAIYESEDAFRKREDLTINLAEDFLRWTTQVAHIRVLDILMKYGMQADSMDKEVGMGCCLDLIVASQTPRPTCDHRGPTECARALLERLAAVRESREREEKELEVLEGRSGKGKGKGKAKGKETGKGKGKEIDKGKEKEIDKGKGKAIDKGKGKEIDKGKGKEIDKGKGRAIPEASFEPGLSDRMEDFPASEEMELDDWPGSPHASEEMETMGLDEWPGTLQTISSSRLTNRPDDLYSNAGPSSRNRLPDPYASAGPSSSNRLNNAQPSSSSGPSTKARIESFLASEEMEFMELDDWPGTLQAISSSRLMNRSDGSYAGAGPSSSNRMNISQASLGSASRDRLNSPQTGSGSGLRDRPDKSYATSSGSGLRGSSHATSSGSGLRGSSHATSSGSGLRGSSHATSLGSGLRGSSHTTSSGSGLRGNSHVSSSAPNSKGSSHATSSGSGLRNQLDNPQTGSGSGLRGSSHASISGSGLRGRFNATGSGLSFRGSSGTGLRCSSHTTSSNPGLMSPPKNPHPNPGSRFWKHLDHHQNPSCVRWNKKHQNGSQTGSGPGPSSREEGPQTNSKQRFRDLPHKFRPESYDIDAKTVAYLLTQDDPGIQSTFEHACAILQIDHVYMIDRVRIISTQRPDRRPNEIDAFAKARQWGELEVVLRRDLAELERVVDFEEGDFKDLLEQVVMGVVVRYNLFAMQPGHDHFAMEF
ncbi:hypothetical protein K402DRAFT_403929 [Aulographum hederae CBS 113979]|uniref:Uncharacterized protein n=1 Tax=Aulographum hederae CBS 113979 TaxID=1176131 RepID=A0A6G1H1R5_9PEZI|nr:hypothetical protein K402DRAFT_403929 [Aulographum hederae CBS 113979]